MKYYGLTKLEVCLFEKINSLVEENRKINGFLTKANGYGVEQPSYRHIVSNTMLLNKRESFNATLISEDEFNKRFEVVNETCILEKKVERHTVDERGVTLIKHNYGEMFKVTIRESNTCGSTALVTIPEYGIELPVSMFSNIESVEPLINTSVNYIGSSWFENKTIKE